MRVGRFEAASEQLDFDRTRDCAFQGAAHTVSGLQTGEHEPASSLTRHADMRLPRDTTYRWSDPLSGAFLPHIWHGQSVGDIVRFHQKLAWFHAHVPREFAQVTPWYTWPWTVRPVVFGGETAVAGEAAVVWCASGKLLWWAVVPMVGYALWRVRERDWRDLLPLAGILATWLPWAPLNRFGMFYYLLPALPFAAILVARALEEWGRRWLMPAYVGTAVILFAAMYPVLAAVPLGQQTLQRYGAAVGVRVGRISAPPSVQAHPAPPRKAQDD